MYRGYEARKDFAAARNMLQAISPDVAEAGAEAKARYWLELGRSYASRSSNPDAGSHAPRSECVFYSVNNIEGGETGWAGCRCSTHVRVCRQSAAATFKRNHGVKRVRLPDGAAMLVVFALTAVVCGCESSRSIQRIEAPSTGCEFVGTVYADQLGDQPAGRATIEVLSHQAGELGGNALQCCEMDAEEAVLYARDSRTGELNTGAHRHFGRAYSCPNRSGGPAPDASPGRTRER